METLLRDLRHGVRMLLKHPQFTVLGIAAMAVGVGANTAVFSLAFRLLVAPLPYPQSDRLVIIHEERAQGRGRSVSYPNFLDWREAQGSLADMSLVREEEVNIEADRDMEPERVGALRATFSFLTTLRLKPQIGRDLNKDDDTPGARPVALISDALWRKRFGASAEVMGRQIVLEGVTYEVIGVMPPEMQYGHRPQLLLPLGNLRADPALLNRGNRAGFVVVGRLKDTVATTQAQAEFDNIARRQAAQFSANVGVRIVVRSFRDAKVGGHLTNLYVLIGAVACILLIACANVAGLVLARATSRQHELAVRAALGASRGRLMAQLLTETTLLCLAGGGTGLLLAVWSLKLVAVLNPAPDMPFADAHINGAALLFTGLVSVGTGLLAGAWPAWQASIGATPATALREAATRSSAGHERQRFRAGLVIAQLALALMLLSSAGLLLRSFWQTQQVALGFDPNNLLLMSVSLPSARYSNGESQGQFYRTVIDRVRALPGVANAASALNIPFDGSVWDSTFRVTGQPPSEPGREPRAEVSMVSPTYLQTMGIPILRGRAFGSEDASGDAWSVIIDELFARQFFADRDPIGEHIDNHQNPAKGLPPMTVVGVVGRTVNDDPSGPFEAMRLPQMYLCTNQNPQRLQTLIVRATSANPLALAEAVKRQVLAVDPNQPVSDLRTMRGAVEEALASRRSTMALITVLAAIALILAAIGLFGIMSLRATQRTREIGIRLALGAQRIDVLRTIILNGLKLTAAGVVIGVLGSLLLGRLMSSLLFGVSAANPLILALVILLLTVVATLATYFPARRAMKVDPIIALREE